MWFFHDNGVAGDSVRWLVWIMTIAIGLLMFSNVRYFSFKTLATNEKVPIMWLFLLMLVLVLLAIDTPTVALGVGLIYIVSGIVHTLNGRRKRQARRALRRRLRHQAAARRSEVIPLAPVIGEAPEEQDEDDEQGDQDREPGSTGMDGSEPGQAGRRRD